jgi:tetratricopeptide (TPR) repeat protein
VQVRGATRYNNDWQRWNSDYYSRHNWRRGSWQGAWYQNYNSRWRQSWRRYPVAVSLGATPWGFNRMGYWFGYNRYYNPYYSRPLVIGTTTIDYSQPLVAAPPEYEDDKTTLTEFDTARDAFKRRQYDKALAAVNLAIVKQPHDATLHEFRALVLFVMGDYHEAAATLNPVLAVGPGWDWDTLRGLYSSVAEYTKHLRALEAYVKEHKERPFGHFLLGYHYLTMGHADAARTQLQRAVALAPKDEVAKNLLTMLDKEAKIPEPAIALPGQDSKVSSEELVGNWNAKRGNGEFTLSLQKDKSFEWVHREGKRSTKVTGTYAYANGTLALEPQAGGVMLATIALKGDDRMQFRMVGADAKDKGLSFSK